jgi:hypothetical protein
VVSYSGEKHKLQTSENKVLGEIFKSKKYEVKDKFKIRTYITKNFVVYVDHVIRLIF